MHNCKKNQKIVCGVRIMRKRVKLHNIDVKWQYNFNSLMISIIIMSDCLYNKLRFRLFIYLIDTLFLIIRTKLIGPLSLLLSFLHPHYHHFLFPSSINVALYILLIFLLPCNLIFCSIGIFFLLLPMNLFINNLEM